VEAVEYMVNVRSADRGQLHFDDDVAVVPRNRCWEFTDGYFSGFGHEGGSHMCAP
jgi:hypothetical protein